MNFTRMKPFLLSFGDLDVLNESEGAFWGFLRKFLSLFTDGANKSQIESCHSGGVIFLTVEGMVNCYSERIPRSLLRG